MADIISEIKRRSVTDIARLTYYQISGLFRPSSSHHLYIASKKKNY